MTGERILLVEGNLKRKAPDTAIGGLYPSTGQRNSSLGLTLPLDPNLNLYFRTLPSHRGAAWEGSFPSRGFR